MAKPRRSIDCPREPIGLSCDEAAAFIGVSASLFQAAVTAGTMPEPRQLGGRLIWDAEEIVKAFRRLPTKGAATQNDGPAPDKWRPSL
jgi:predicted DNA-binding transcriptional regulator AlpA